MKTCKLLSVVFMAIAVFSGCSSLNAAHKSDMSQNAGLWNGANAVSLQEGIAEANTQCESGDYRAAIRKYDDLLDRYGSAHKRVKIGLMTAQAICFLEDGDQNGFLRTADQLDQVTHRVKHLSRETQVVLELQKTMSGTVFANDDPRIEQRISSSINSLFEGGDK